MKNAEAYPDHYSQDCPECDGEGQVTVARDRAGPRGEHRTDDVTFECAACDGSGKVPTGHAFAQAHGDLIREVADLLHTTERGAKIAVREAIEATAPEGAQTP